MTQNSNFSSAPSSSTGTGSYRNFIERDKRHIVRLWARVRQPMRDLEVSVIVSNLSRSGCKIESMISFDPKAPVLLTYQSFPTIRAQIMWSKTGSNGCKFEKPIPDHILAAIVAQG